MAKEKFEVENDDVAYGNVIGNGLFNTQDSGLEIEGEEPLKPKEKSKPKENDEQEEKESEDGNKEKEVFVKPLFGDEDTDEEEEDAENDKEKGAAKEKKPKEPKGDDDVDYKNAYELNVKLGIWNEVDFGDEEPEFDGELFDKIKNAQEERKESKLKEGVYEKLDPTDKEFLEFKKNGGDINQWVNSVYNQKQLEEFDTSTDSGKKSIIASYYKNTAGWTDAKIDRYIKTLEEGVELDEEADFAKGKMDELTKQNHQKLVEDQAKLKRQQEEAEKKYKDDTKNILKEQGYKTTDVNMILRDIADRDESGFTKLDRVFVDARNNPERAPELREFLMNRESFVKKLVQAEINKSKLEDAKKIKIKTDKKESPENTGKPKKEEKGLIILD